MPNKSMIFYMNGRSSFGWISTGKRALPIDYSDSVRYNENIIKVHLCYRLEREDGYEKAYIENIGDHFLLFHHSSAYPRKRRMCLGGSQTGVYAGCAIGRRTFSR